MEFKGKRLICLNRIWLIAHNGASLMAVTLTSPLLTVVCHREDPILGPFSFLIYDNDLPVYRSESLECTLMTLPLLMLVLICIWFSLVRPWNAKKMACVQQTYLECYKHGIYVDWLQVKIKYSIWYTRTFHVQIEQVSSVKSLGVYVKKNLRRHSHFDKLY